MESDQIIYYYINVDKPYEIQTTEILDELVTLLYEGTADFISDGQRIELKLPDNYFELLKKLISDYAERVPMYDIESNHIFLIHWQNVYQRIFFDNYRFVDKHFSDDLKSLVAPSESDKENIRILSYYDMSALKKTYLRIFYESFVINSYITNCRRPSFYSSMEHIAPYYTIKEINYLAHDWDLTTKITLDQDEINELCKVISKYDIPAKTLLDHQMYIYRSNAIGLVKHYSLFGSYYMNVYLRQSRCCVDASRDYSDVIRNLYLENQIIIMIKLLKNAPVFTKSHTVYRFVERDHYMAHLKVGDIYQDTSFMSTTRNPFYYKENYAFGYILLKIKLPKDTIGVGLCIESYSNFPKEEEIVLPPTSRYRLESVTDAVANTDFHGYFDLRVQKRYEFTWVGNDYIGMKDSEIAIKMPGSIVPKINRVDLGEIFSDESFKYVTITERLEHFRQKYVTVNNQFETAVGNNTYIFNMEAYDSTTVYKPFFYYVQKNGLMITTSNPKYGNINILMELGTEIHVNYYFRFSVTDPSIVVDLNREEWIRWLSLLAYIIGSRTVVIHSNYSLQYNEADSIEKKLMKTKYTFSQNIYMYMKYKKKMFEFVEVTPHFDYGQLDYLTRVKVSDYVKSSDKNELYRLARSSGIEYMYDFYLYIIENFPKQIKVIEEKMSEVYQDPSKNPFINVEYSLDAWLYLYNHDMIRIIPSEKEFNIKKGSFKKLVGNKKIPKFKNRLRSFIQGYQSNQKN